MSRYGRTMADAYKEVIKYSEEPEVVEAETVAETEPEEVEDLNEVAPPGWAGTVKAMKKHKDIDNPYALSWHMKKKGYKSHKKEEVEIDELTADQKKKREASRQRTHGGDEYKKMAHTADRSQKKPDRNVRKYWEKPSSMRAGPKGKLPEDIQMDDLANYDHHDYGFDTRADMVAYVEGSLSATQKAAREKSRGRFGIGNRKHNNSPQAAHSLGFGTGGDHQNRGVKKVRGAKEALDTWHPDPEKDRKTTSMKHTAKAVRQHARRDKPATFARKKVTPDQIRDILAKQRARKAAQNEAIQFKVKIKDLPAFYVPGKSAGQVKSALRKNLRHPEDIEAIDRVTEAGKKKDFRLRAQGKQ